MRSQICIWGREEQYRNYAEAIAAAGGLACFGEDPKRCDALLLPGGGDLEPWRYGQKNTASRNLDKDRDQTELDLLDEFTAAGKPVLGICRGLQTINVFFGGTLIQDLSGHSAADGEDRFHRVRTLPSVFSGLYGEACVVNSAHHQAADQLGSGLRAVQWTGDGVIEAVCHRTLPVWAVQWHPERLRGTFAKHGTADGDALFTWFLALCGR